MNKKLPLLVLCLLAFVGIARADIDYAIDFTNNTWTSSLSTQNVTNRCWVTSIADGVPTYSTSNPGDYLMYFEGYFKDNTYGLYYGNPKFEVAVGAGTYRITLGCSDYGGAVDVKVGSTTLTTINNSGGKYSASHTNVAVGLVTVNEACTITVTTSNNNIYFPYFQIQSLAEFSDFKVDFRVINGDDEYTVILPGTGTLPNCVSIAAGTHNGNQHGAQNPSITVDVDRPVLFTIGSCQFGNHTITVTNARGGSETIDNNNGCENGVSSIETATYTKYVTYLYNSTTSTTLTFSVDGYLPFFFAVESPLIYNGFAIVDNSGTDLENGASLKKVIDYANSSSYDVFLPNGTYDLGDEIDDTHPGITISRAMNIIGESMAGVIIKAETESANESINSAAVKIEHGVTGVYLQNLTIQNYAKAFNVSTSAERALALWDRGNQTVLKNVYLRGTQDTYYTNKTEAGQKIYYEGGKIEGTVDFICGAGDVYFEKTKLYVANSATAGKTSGDYIAAPRTYSSELYGYVFNNCTITGESTQAGTYYLARAWAETPRCTYVNPDYSACEPAVAKWGASMGPTTFYFSETPTPISVSTVLGSEFATAARAKIDTYIKEVTLNNVTEASHGYATFCSSWNFTISGAKAYKAALSGSSLVLTELSGIIPAEAGVVIMGEKGATATISYSPLASTAVMDGNVLEGTTSSGARPQTMTNFYAFDKTVNMFKIYTGTNFPANKAFFQTDGAVGAPAAIRFADEESHATDIMSVEGKETAVKFFDGGRILIMKNGVVYDALGRVIK